MISWSGGGSGIGLLAHKRYGKCDKAIHVLFILARDFNPQLSYFCFLRERGKGLHDVIGTTEEMSTAGRLDLLT